jgi:hypothetical protein
VLTGENMEDVSHLCCSRLWSRSSNLLRERIIVSVQKGTKQMDLYLYHINERTRQGRTHTLLSLVLCIH